MRREVLPEPQSVPVKLDEDVEKEGSRLPQEVLGQLEELDKKPSVIAESRQRKRDITELSEASVTSNSVKQSSLLRGTTQLRAVELSRRRVLPEKVGSFKQQALFGKYTRRCTAAAFLGQQRKKAARKS